MARPEATPGFAIESTPLEIDFRGGPGSRDRQTPEAIGTGQPLSAGAARDMADIANKRQTGYRFAMAATSLNIQLSQRLRQYVDERAGDDGIFSTPSEYIRHLIREDMIDSAIAKNILEGLSDLRRGRLSTKSIQDIGDDD